MRISAVLKKRCSKWLCNHILFLFLFSLLLLLGTCPGCAWYSAAKTDPALVLGFVDLINRTGDRVPVNLKKKVFKKEENFRDKKCMCRTWSLLQPTGLYGYLETEKCLMISSCQLACRSGGLKMCGMKLWTFRTKKWKKQPNLDCWMEVWSFVSFTFLLHLFSSLPPVYWCCNTSESRFLMKFKKGPPVLILES
jgi:hypothetical protein